MCICLQIISKATLETSTYIYFIVREPFLGILEFSPWDLIKIQVVFGEENLSGYLSVALV